MKVHMEEQSRRQVLLRVELEPQEMEAGLDRASRRLAGQVRVPGFRPGKAPRYLVERYVGRERLLAEALEDLLSSTYEKALRENGIEALASPRVEIVQREPLVYEAVVPLKPVVELGDYRELRLPPPRVEVTESEVEQALERLRYEEAPWEPVSREVREGDLALLEVRGWVDDRLYINEDGAQYVARLGARPLPGFYHEILGLEKGQEKEFTLPFPDGHPFRGKQCRFKVRVLEVKAKNPLPLDDGLARSLGFNSLSELREEIAGRIKARAEAEARREYEERVLDEVAERSRVEFPPVMVEWQLEQWLREQNIAGEEERLREELYPRAEKEVARTLLLDRIAEAEGVTVSEAELEDEISRMAQGEKGEEVRRFFRSPGARESLRDTLRRRRALERLLEVVAEQGEGVSDA